MRIVYLVNTDTRIASDATERHILQALKKEGCEVVVIPEAEALRALTEKCDLLLFHKGGPYIKRLLLNMKCKKAFWYFDKIWQGRVVWAQDIIPLVDIGFMTDGTWLLKNPDPKLHIIHQGIGGKDLSPGKKLSQCDADVVFTGSIYGDRSRWIASLFSRYQNKFKIYTAFNRSLFDLCASIPIFVAPPHPSDDLYWSSRIYITLGSGGFLIHPKCKGLDEEYEDGKHYVSYSSDEEMFEKIDYYLAHPEEREAIRLAGMKKTQECYTYHHRVKELLSFL